MTTLELDDETASILNQLADLKQCLAAINKSTAPDSVKLYAKKLIGGDKSIRFEGKVVTNSRVHYSHGELETIKRLIGKGMDHTWERLSQLDDKQKVKFFESAFTAAVNYDAFRKSNGASRKYEAKKLIADIKKKSIQLKDLLDKLEALPVDERAVIRSGVDRFTIQESLDFIVQEIDSIHIDFFYPDKFIADAVSNREASENREYLRGFLSLLKSKDVSLELTGIINAVAETATIVLNKPDGGISYQEARKIFAEYNEKYN